MIDTGHWAAPASAAGETPQFGGPGSLPSPGGQNDGRPTKILIEFAVGIVAAVVVAALAMLAFALVSAPAKAERHLVPGTPGPAGVTVVVEGSGAPA